MKDVHKRPLVFATLAAFVGALAFLAAGCGGDDGGDSSASDAWQLPGLGTTLEEVQANARNEGEVNVVQWPTYAVLTDEFESATGCKLNTKDANTGDEMITLIQSGEYDGVSASGHTSVRLMEAGDVAPVNPDLLPNYADIEEGIKLKSYNSKDGEPYGGPHGRGPNYLMFRTDEVNPPADSWSAVFDTASPYKGKISVYDDNIFFADAALYLKATQPDLGIEDPYQLTTEQFEAVKQLMKDISPNVGEWWGDYAKQIQSFKNKDVVVGTVWPLQYNVLTADKEPVAVVKPKEGTTGWSDTWMIASKAQNPNCMYLWINHMMSPEAQATATEGFGEAPVNLKACDLTKNPNHCDDYHAADETWWEDVYYWDTPREDCGDDDDATTCVTQQDWRNAWTEIRG
jgi:putative spermidine/putrescine transport system substrate-binding protein